MKDNTSLWNLLNEIKKHDFIDLTHAFHPGIPHATGLTGVPDQKFESLYNFEEHGFQAHIYTHVGQWGTHVDPPGHFKPGGRMVDQITVKEMLLPMVCFDCTEKSQKNPDYLFTLDDLKQWELLHGNVPGDAFAVMKTEWSKFWPSRALMMNFDAEGMAHFPGWSKDVVRYLIEERKVKAFGHETTDTDGGITISKNIYPVESLILEKDCYQIELLNNLTQVPQVGAIASVTFPKPKDGSGYPARVFAICPNTESQL